MIDARSNKYLGNLNRGSDFKSTYLILHSAVVNVKLATGMFIFLLKLLSPMVNLIQIKNKQYYFTANHYISIEYMYFFEFHPNPCLSLKSVKQIRIRASSGHGRISRFINITEFPSPRILLESK